MVPLSKAEHQPFSLTNALTTACLVCKSVNSDSAASISSQRVFVPVVAPVEVSLLRLRTLLSATHLALVESVACSDRVLLCRNNVSLSLLEQGTPHGLLGLLARRGRVDHFLALQQDVVDPVVLVVDRWTTTHPVHEVGVHRHLARVYEFVSGLLARDCPQAASCVG